MGNVTKAQVIEYAQSRLDDLVQLTSDLIKIPSENPTGSQREVVDFVKKYLADAGIEHKEISCNPEFPCVVAQVGPDEGFSIILNGHVDVVPAGDRKQWNFDPFSGEITDKEILGRGTSDMKAGVAGLLFAMKALTATKADLKGNLRLHIVSDEESGGQYGTSWLLANGYADNADACLVAEPTSYNTIEIGQKGRIDLIIKAHGVSAHGSLAGHKGVNAIQRLMKVLEHVDLLTEVEGRFTPDLQQALENSKIMAAMKNGAGTDRVIDHVTANIGMISGGNRPNMVPDYAEAILDLRLPIGVDLDDVDHAVKAMIEKSGVEGVDYVMNVNGMPNNTDINAPIVSMIKKYAEQYWNAEVLPAWQWASSDAREYRMKGIPTIQYGPSNTVGIHSYNETVDIEDVRNAGMIYLNAFCDLLGLE